MNLRRTHPSTRPADWKGFPKNKLQRYRVEVASKEGSLVDTSLLYGKNIDFPSINPKVGGSVRFVSDLRQASSGVPSTHGCEVQFANARATPNLLLSCVFVSLLRFGRVRLGMLLGPRHYSITAQKQRSCPR